MGGALYIVAAPAPYRNAELDRAALALPPGTVRAVFMEPVNATGVWRHQFPRHCEFRCIDAPSNTQGLALSELEAHLNASRPDWVILGGYRQAAVRQAMAWCQKQGVPWALRSDSNIWSDRLKGVAKYLVRRVRLGACVRRATRVLITGRYNREFWERYGMRPGQAGWWPQWIDYDHFAQASSLRERQRNALREHFGLQARFSLLYVGRLIPRKGVEVLCEAVAGAVEDVGLVIAGRGPEEPKLRQQFAARMGPRLRMLGAVEPADLPKLYAACDVLALASGPSEPWGMVLNEATAAGLPIICHRYVGAAGDLLEHEGNGLALVADSIPRWREAITRISSDAALWQRMSRRSLEIADDWRKRSEPGHCLAELLGGREKSA